MSESSIDDKYMSLHIKRRVTGDSNSCKTRAIGVGTQVLGYNQLVGYVGIHGQRRLTEALNKDSLVRQKEYPTESSSKSRERYNQLISHVGIHGQRRLTEALNKDSLVR
ncbi:hypothetical protein Taro_002045 [Colocasia esculenta]|uniref:Uncharacterized protein n=1 Tax=Colocasia esculenta TaxID=4460 RepID=A0A843TI03_COLES|nr:hypothetical protein [Colocasia esculenta]